MTIGETLKRARKKMDLDLDQVAEATKIAKMFLIALENDDISSLPSGVYARNFLRAYARFLKLDEDIITAEYHEQFNVTPHFVAHQEQTKLDDQVFRRQRLKMQLVLVIMIFILGAVGFYLWRLYEEKQASASPAATTTLPVSVDRSAEVPEPADPVVSEREVVENSQPMADSPMADSPVTDTPAEESMVEGASSAEPEPEATAVEDDNDPEEALSEEDPPTFEAEHLPVSDLSLAVWTPADRPAEEMADMFAVESLDAVWVEVVIDGESLTNRILNKGQVRYYRYGEVNSLVVGDTSKVAIQDGGVFRARLDQRNLSPKLREFKAGGLLKSYEAWLVEHGPQRVSEQ